MRTDADRSVISSSDSNIISVLYDSKCTDQQDLADAASCEKAIRGAMSRSREEHAKVLVELAKF